MSMSTHGHEGHGGHACCGPQKKWHEKKVWRLIALCLIFAAISGAIPLSQPFARAFWEYLKMVAGPIGLGLLLGGIIDRFVPTEYISRLLARPKKRTVFYAAGLGFLASACSHGILALSMELHKKGASGPAVISFLLASPWANLPLTILMIGFFGAKGFLIIGSAVIVAFVTGFIFLFLDEKGLIEKNKHTLQSNASFSVLSDIKKRMKNYRLTGNQFVQDSTAVMRSTRELAEMVLGWIFIGVILASLARAYVPAHFFHHYMGPTPTGLLLTLLVATLLEVCSEGTAPLAFEIYRQTRALGNSFVFLMAGVITDWTEIGLVGSNLGKKTAFWMVAVGVPQTLILGILLNQLF